MQVSRDVLETLVADALDEIPPELASETDDVVELAAQVRVTVLHEVGHHFGMRDERLHELGWA